MFIIIQTKLKTEHIFNLSRLERFDKYAHAIKLKLIDCQNTQEFLLSQIELIEVCKDPATEIEDVVTNSELYNPNNP